jgi:hypothetical protein
VIGEDAASFLLVLPYMGIKKGSCRKKENTLLIYHVYVNVTRLGCILSDVLVFYQKWPCAFEKYMIV